MKNPLRTLTRRQLIVSGIVLTVGIAAAAAYFTFGSSSAGGGRKEGGAFGGMGGFGGNKVQPVSAAEVKVADVPVWISAIGTLIPRNLVTVRSRVDGELYKLYFKEGQTVKAGQLLAELDPRAFQVQLMQANGQMARDTALLKNAQLDLERYRLLLSKDAISKQQVDTQEALVRQYQGTVETDKGVVANAQLQLSYTRITAPVSGRVGLRQVDPGNIVKTGDTNGIVVIAQVQPITAVFSVPETQLQLVTQAISSKTPVAVELWDREQKRKLATGTLLTADNQIDTSTGTLKLKAEFANADNALFSNQFANVRLAGGIVNGAKVVPSSAVLRGSKGAYVYVINENKVSAVPVTAGVVSGDLTVIEGAIEAGNQVVTDGADKLREGGQVEVITAEARNKAMNADGKKRGKKPADKEGTADSTKATTADAATGAASAGDKKPGEGRRERDKPAASAPAASTASPASAAPTPAP